MEYRKPNRAFFESDPTAATIRTATLDGAGALDAYLAGGDHDAIGRVMDANQALRGLGVEPGMHVLATDDPEREAKRQLLLGSPLLAAQYVGGQFLSALDLPTALDIPERSAIAEHDELLGEGAPGGLFNLGSTDPSVVDYFKRISIIGTVRMLFDETGEGSV